MLRVSLCAALFVLCAWSPAFAETKTENVLFITFDGLRWEELFGGAETAMLRPGRGNIKDLPGIRARFNRETAEERREALLPFFWSVIAKEGSVFGDPAAGSPAQTENNRVFSYPGYNEILTGFADDENITSNAKKNNENVTVLEWLNQKDAYHGKVMAFGSWDVFPYIINSERSGIPVNAGWMDLEGDDPWIPALNRVAREIPKVWPSVRYDLFTYEGARVALNEKKPRVLYVSFGETDDWGHEGRYDLYLDSAYRTDEYIRLLWEQVQSMPQYAGKTSLVLTTDHGRGAIPDDWKSHGNNIEGARYIWLAVMGPDTPATGIVKDTPATQSQAAATVATLLGEDYNAAQPKAAKPLPGVVK